MFVALILLFLLVLILRILVLLDSGVVIISIKIFNVGFFGDLEFLINVWRILFLFMVVLISFSVIIFSISYIRGLVVRNFILLYIRFIIRILWLIINNNFYWIIFGWDGPGVVSFLLIIFYINHERINNGLFTLFQNRVGDLFFVLFILGIIDIVIWNNIVLKWGVLFLVLGGCVKRAQFPFNAWLLSAMRAPTPISSLVHSSTLVVAGVYILLQFRYCLIDVLYVLKYVRILRLILSSFGLLNEIDMKKLIAFSTISHVSLIIYILSFRLYKVVYFHLNIHAMFKSLIFMCFGFVILSSFHRQDKRLVSYTSVNPLIKIIYYFSCICLAGLPFLRGFFSKDFIIEKTIELNGQILFVVLLLLFLRIRIYYSVKLLRLSNFLYSYAIMEKRFLGLLSLGIIRFIIISIINVFISLVFRVRYELISFKISIYFLIFFFIILRILTNLNFKITTFEKIKNFKETWALDYYILDKFIYWNMFSIIQYIRVLRNVKLILLINWWILILFVVLF